MKINTYLSHWKSFGRLYASENFALHAGAISKKNDVQKPLKRIVCLASDPDTVFGALGDQALVLGLRAGVRAISEGCDVRVIKTIGTTAAEGPFDLSDCLDEAWAWSGLNGHRAAVSIMQSAQVFFVIGADVMDGHYSPTFSRQAASYLRMANRLGIPTAISGFSFNDSPNEKAVLAIRSMPKSTQFFLRDTVSLERFQRHTGRDGALVADVAFLMPPDSDAHVVKAVTNWIATQKREGRVVVGVNLHPMLFRPATPASSAQLIQSGTAAVKKLIELGCSVVLIPHDFRDADGDNEILKPMFNSLSEVEKNNVYWIDEKLFAPQAKAIAGSLDCLITARMHLAIGALAMGVPVAGVTYQGKFEGLMNHFGLDNELLISAERFSNSQFAVAYAEKLLQRHMAVKPIIVAHLPAVLAMAKKNVDWIDADS